MKIFEAFLPMDRRQALASGETIPAQLEGTLLFADISRFTLLMGTYIQKLGRQRGTEELSLHLDLFFDTIIKHLYNFQGSVISFSGDAITCWFKEDDGRRALAASQSIQAAVAPFSSMQISSGYKVAIQLKISITWGRINRYLLGDPDITRFEVMVGAAVDRLAEAELLAERGEILLGKAVYHNCKTLVELKEWRYGDSSESYAVLRRFTKQMTPQPWPKLSTLSKEQCRAWLLPSIFERLNTGQGAFLTELRRGVACFIKYSLHTYKNELPLDELDAFICQIQHIAQSYGGNVLQLTFGDKGNIIFLGFGAPISHEDDVDRALNMALEIRKLSRSFSQIKELMFGISQGQLRTGYYGGKNRNTYTFLGEHTNLAARMVGLATSDQILVSQSVQQVASDRFEFNLLGSLTLKGFVKPIPVFVLEKKMPINKEVITVASHFTFNREKEKRQIILLKELVEQRESRKLLLESKTGLGKTNFSYWFEEQAKKQGFTILKSKSSAIDQNVPYHSLLAVLVQLFEIDLSNESEFLLKERINSRLLQIDADLLKWAPLLGTVLQIEWEETEVTRLLDGAERGQKFIWLFKYIFKHVCEKEKIALVLENAQWMDESTCKLIEELINELPPFFLLMMVRSDDHSTPPNYQKLKAHPWATNIQMEPLLKEEIYQVIVRTHSCTRINSGVFDLVFGKTGGNPQFALAIFNALLEEEKLEIKEKVLDIKHSETDLQSLILPDSLQGVFINQFDRLSARQQLVIKVASVLGASFPALYLQAIHPVEDDKLMLTQILDELEQLRFIKKDHSEEGLHYTFEHQLAQQVVYDLVPFELRRQLHLALVEWMQQKYASNLAPYYPSLAHHTEAAEDYQNAVFFWGKLGENASRFGAYAEAEKNLLHAIKLLDKLPASQTSLKKKLELLILLGSVRLATHGQTADTVRDVYLEAQQISEAIEEDLPQKAVVYFGLSAYHLFSGSLLSTQKFAQKALAIAQRMEDEQSQIQAHLMLANSSFWKSEFALEQYHVDCVWSLYRHDDFRRHLSHFAQNPKITSAIDNVWAKCLLGYPDQAHALSEEVMNLALEMDHAYSLTLVYQTKAYMYQLLLEPEKALKYGELLTNISEKEGFPMFISMGQIVTGWAKALMEKSEEGIALIRTGMDFWLKVKAIVANSLFVKLLMEAYDASQKWEEGLHVFAEWDAMFSNTESQVFLPALYFLKGKFLEKTGEEYLAKGWYVKSMELAGKYDNYLATSRAAARLAEMKIRDEQYIEAHELLHTVYDVQKTTPYQTKLKELLAYLSTKKK